MICRVLLLCVVAIAALPTQVAAFSSAPARGSSLKGAASSPSSSRATATSHSALYAVKKAAKKSATKKAAKKTSKKSDVEVVNFKKADFVSAVSEKTGMTKGESEMALAAVLNVISTVSTSIFSVFWGRSILLFVYH